MHPLTKGDQIPPTPALRLPPPPGVAGDIAKFVFNTLDRPVPEVAILAALGILAGVCGKAFEVGGYGLNIRTVFIADDCVAEYALEQGIRSIISAVSKSYPAITQFVEYYEFSNGPALAKLNLPLLDVPLSRSIMRPSIAVPRASFSQTAWG
jgi:hypothetical protein